MSLFMDVHTRVDGLTPEAVAGAHQKDLEIQEARGVQYLKYWFDETSGQAWLSVARRSDAPRRQLGLLSALLTRRRMSRVSR
jgi:hypothetical protein